MKKLIFIIIFLLIPALAYAGMTFTGMRWGKVPEVNNIISSSGNNIVSSSGNQLVS